MSFLKVSISLVSQKEPFHNEFKEDVNFRITEPLFLLPASALVDR